MYDLMRVSRENIDRGLGDGEERGVRVSVAGCSLAVSSLIYQHRGTKGWFNKARGGSILLDEIATSRRVASREEKTRNNNIFRTPRSVRTFFTFCLNHPLKFQGYLRPLTATE